MANTTIDQLASLTGTSVASNDLFLVYDASTNIEKSITSAEMKNMIGNGSFTFTIAGTSDALIVTSTDAGATAAPDIVFYRNSASPAASDAMTVEKALMVDPRTPIPAPSIITATPTSAS